MSWNNIIPVELLELEVQEAKAIEIVAQVLKDRKAWGESAGIRVAQYELVNALLALESRLTGDHVSTEELTTERRRYNAMAAQLAKAQVDSKRMREERDKALSELKAQNIGKVSK